MMIEIFQAAIANSAQSEAVISEDRSLTPEEAATMPNVTVDWLYRHSAELPFTRKLSRKCLRFSEAGLKRYLSTRRVVA